MSASLPLSDLRPSAWDFYEVPIDDIAGGAHRQTRDPHDLRGTDCFIWRKREFNCEFAPLGTKDRPTPCVRDDKTRDAITFIDASSDHQHGKIVKTATGNAEKL
jgi:hypothetical protein